MNRRLAHRRGLLVGVPMLAAAILGLWSISRGKWSDALIDSGREWIVPDALAHGELLYRDVVYWFGPWTPYFHALFFRLFGSSFATLVLAGVVGSLGVLAALWLALRRVTGSLEAALWTALAVPALLFMPYSGGSILGMGFRIWHAAAFALCGVAMSARPRKGGGIGTALASGALAGLAGLCRTEWGIIALAGCLLTLGVIERWGGLLWRRALAMSAAFFALFGLALGFFLAAAGPRAVLREGHVLLTHLPSETLHSFLRPRSLPSGLAELFFSAGLWVGVFLLLEIVSLPRIERLRARGRVAALMGILALLSLLVSIGLARGAAPLFSAGPLLCLAALAAGLRRSGRPRSAALAGFGLLGILAFHRRFFHITDAAYVAPPLLFAFVCAAGLLAARLARVRGDLGRRRVRAAFAGGVVALVTLAFAGRAAQYAGSDRVPIPGTGGFLSARVDLVREIAGLAERVERETAKGAGLVVFPEGEILNFLSGRPNPIRHKLYLPGYVTAGNQDEIVSELSRRRPEAVVIWRRPAGEYGRGLFGEDYGQRIQKWIDANYRMAPFAPEGVSRRTYPPFSYGLRRDP